jgi:hypothetical protein
MGGTTKRTLVEMDRLRVENECLMADNARLCDDNVDKAKAWDEIAKKNAEIERLARQLAISEEACARFVGVVDGLRAALNTVKIHLAGEPIWNAVVMTQGKVDVDNFPTLGQMIDRALNHEQKADGRKG